MSEAYDKLNAALADAGVPRSNCRHVEGADLTATRAVNVLVNSKIDAAPYAEILLAFAPQLSAPREVDMVARCMSQSKGFRAAVPWLLSLFDYFPGNGLSESNLWAIGLAIYTINARPHYPAVISICRNRKYGSGRQTLMGVLARAKTEEAFETLVQCLDDPNVRGHAIEALGRFGCTRALPILEALDVDPQRYESKAKQTAIRRLRRKEPKQKT